MKLQLVLPCYNEAHSLKNLFERTISQAKSYGFSSESFQLVMVDNGSLDHSQDVFKDLQQSPDADWLKVVVVAKNQGYGYGLQQGLKVCSAEVLAWSHSDLQCDPQDVFKAHKLLLAEEENLGHKKILIKGTRFGRNWKDRFVSFVFAMFAWVILGYRLREINAQPKVFRRELFQLLTRTGKAPPNNFAFDLYVLYLASKDGYLFFDIPVLFPPRIHGVSNWASNFFSRYKTILGMIAYMFALKRVSK